MTNLTNYDSRAPFGAYITNLGKYNEGELIGEWVYFPIKSDELKDVFKRIVLNAHYEEYFITDYDMNIEALKCEMLGSHCGEYVNVDDLNKLAIAIKSVYDMDLLNAVIEYESPTSIDELINIIDNIDNYCLYSDINNDYDLGYYWIEKSGCYDLSNMGNLSNYIDYERFGRDIDLEGGGMFTSYGWLEVC